MKWNHKIFTHGEARRRRAFLFFPKTIENQTRWFEFATWQENFRVSICDTMRGKYKSSNGYWEEIRWLENSVGGPPNPRPTPKPPPQQIEKKSKKPLKRKYGNENDLHL
jgi:hypothetical protein